MNSYREVLIILPGRPVFFAVLGRFVAEVGPKTLLNGSGSIFCCGNQGSLARGTNSKAIFGVGDRPRGSFRCDMKNGLGRMVRIISSAV